MTVYVDEIRVYPNAWGPFRKGSCHLTADTLEELHALAEKIGCRRAWFQDHRLAPHCDLTAAKRQAALDAGAVFVSAMEQARKRIAARRAVREEK